MSEVAPPCQKPVRILELDGLRGVAVLMVLAWHFVGLMFSADGSPWESALYQFLRLGRTGVDLFFVLSGFLITGIVLDRKQAAKRFLFSFYVRRSLRILPPYLALIGIFWILVALGVNNRGVNAQTPIWYHLTLTQNWWMAAHRTLGPDALAVTWSVAIEEQYYVAAPLILMLLPRRWIPAFLMLVAASSASFRAWIYSDTGSHYSAYILTPARLDGLAAGGLVAFIWQAPKTQAWLAAHALGLARLTLLAALLGLLFLAAMMARDMAWHMFTWGHTFLAVLACLIVTTVLLKAGSSSMNLLRDSRLRFVGSISYSLYLFHPCILGAAIMLLGHKPVHNDWRDWLVVLGALAMSIAVCAASNTLIERRLIAFGHRFRY